MLFAEEDTRKVQTAVAGGPGSDSPLFLPFDHEDFDRFMRGRQPGDFYCGRLLGGCGKRLSAKRYLNKKCHFAHIASGHCHRTATNEASADHLYIGRALAAWLKKQRSKNVQVRYQHKGHQSLREFVDISYTRGAGPHLMRVQLARRSKGEWEATDAQLQGRWAGAEWLFGPDSMLANWQVDRQGYALRIQCRPFQLTRAVEVGVQFPGAPVEWVSLDTCRMTTHGIQPPLLALTPQGLAPRGQQMPTLPSDGARTRPTVPQQVRRTEARHHVDRPSTPVATSLATEPIQPSSLPPVPPPTDREISAAFRGALQETARSGGLINTQSLAERANVSAGSLTPARWVELLRLVESRRKKGEPVLSALIVGPRREPAPFLRELLRLLNWTSVQDEHGFKEFCRRHRELAYTAYADHQATPIRRAAVPVPAPRLVLPEPSFEGPSPLPASVSLDQIQASDDRQATERLGSLLDHLDDRGEELHLDQLQAILRKIAACEQGMWRRPASDLQRRVTTWRSHAAMLAARPTLREIRAYADVLRLTLRTAALMARPLTWMDLGLRLDSRLPALHPDDKVAVLVEVDRDACSDRPLLSALVAARGHRVHPLYAQVLDHLDRPVPHPHEAQAAWEQDVRSHRRSGETQFVITAQTARAHA